MDRRIEATLSTALNTSAIKFSWGWRCSALVTAAPCLHKYEQTACVLPAQPDITALGQMSHGRWSWWGFLPAFDSTATTEVDEIDYPIRIRGSIPTAFLNFCAV